MRKVLFGVLVIVLIVCLCSCNEEMNDGEDTWNTRFGEYEITDYISPDGVHYWIRGGGGIAPRYDRNGNLVIEPMVE